MSPEPLARVHTMIPIMSSTKIAQLNNMAARSKTRKNHEPRLRIEPFNAFRALLFKCFHGIAKSINPGQTAGSVFSKFILFALGYLSEYMIWASTGKKLPAQLQRPARILKFSM